MIICHHDEDNVFRRPQPRKALRREDCTDFRYKIALRRALRLEMLFPQFFSVPLCCYSAILEPEARQSKSTDNL